MKDKSQYKRIVLHVSPEMMERIERASTKNKLSFGSIVREAVKRYLDESEKGTKGA